MREVRLRRVSNGTIILLLVLLTLFFVVAAFLLYKLYLDDLSLFYWFTIFYTILFFIPIISVTSVALYRYCTRVTVTEKCVSVAFPTGKRMHMPSQDISAMGRISFAGLDSKMFFCIAPQCEVVDFYENHEELCKKMFGDKQMRKLEQTKEGRWKMAVAVYAYYSKKKKIFYLYHHSESTLHEIAHLLKKEMMVTGSILGQGDGSVVPPGKDE